MDDVCVVAVNVCLLLFRGSSYRRLLSICFRKVSMTIRATVHCTLALRTITSILDVLRTQERCFIGEVNTLVIMQRCGEHGVFSISDKVRTTFRRR